MVACFDAMLLYAVLVYKLVADITEGSDSVRFMWEISVDRRTEIEVPL